MNKEVTEKKKKMLPYKKRWLNKLAKLLHKQSFAQIDVAASKTSVTVRLDNFLMFSGPLFAQWVTVTQTQRL